MTHKKFVPTKIFQIPLVVLAYFLILSMSASGCRCGNAQQAKSSPTPAGSIGMKVTPTELEGDQRTTTVTFIPEYPGRSGRSVSLASYQLQVSFEGNAQVYYKSSKQVDQALRNQEKVKLERLLSTSKISTNQDMSLTIVPGLNLPLLEMEIHLLDARDQVVQKYTVRWKLAKSLSSIRISLGHNQANHRVIYALENEGKDAWANIQLRYANISADEEGKKVVLDNQTSGTLPIIPQLVGVGRTDNRFIAIDFKHAQQAAFKFEVINQQNQVLATKLEVFHQHMPAIAGNYQAFQEIAQEIKKEGKAIDTDKMKRLLDQSGIDLNQLTPRDQYDRYIYPLTLVSRAVQQDNLDMVKLFINKGANLDTRSPGGVGALEMAAEGGDRDMVQTLLAAGAPVNGSPTTAFGPIHLAGRYGNVPMLQELLKSDQLDLNKPDGGGKTGLHFVIHACGRAAQDNQKQQALLEIMKEMISKGAGINQQDASGSTPLHWAVIYHSLNEVFELLLNDPNIQVDVQDEDGDTPLHKLVHDYLLEKDPGVLKKFEKQISLFIQHGARIDLKSKPWEERREADYMDGELKKLDKSRAGKSVLALAEESGNNELIKLLKGEII